jgi:hypothetical protein
MLVSKLQLTESKVQNREEGSFVVLENEAPFSEISFILL